MMKDAKECVTDLEKLSEIIIFGLISTTFEASIIFEAVGEVSKKLIH